MLVVEPLAWFVVVEVDGKLVQDEQGLAGLMI